MDILSRKQALQQNSIHYYTGKPCKHGHVAFRFTKRGTCVVCHTIMATNQNKTSKGKSSLQKAQQKYFAREKGKLSIKKYIKSIKGQLATQRHLKTAKYQERRTAYNQTLKVREYRKLLRLLYKNTGYSAHMNAKRRALLHKTLVPWANLGVIKQIYAEAAQKTKTTGIPHNVDHIIPLQGKYVCGLHVETNLRVITAHENFTRPKIYNSSE